MDTTDETTVRDELQEWIAALASPDPVVREQSREALVEAADCDVTRALVKALMVLKVGA